MKIEKHNSKEDSELDEAIIKERYQDYFTDSDMARLLLTLIEAKPATDVEGFFPDKETFQSFVEEVNSAGFNCYVEREPDETDVENFVEFAGIEEDGMTDAELVVRIFVTPDEYGKGYFQDIVGGNYGEEFHRKYGRFLGFDEESIESFVYLMMPWWRKPVYRLRNKQPREAVDPVEAARNYRPRLDKEELEILSAFTFQRIADREETLEKKMEEAREMKSKVEESGLDPEFFIENLSDPRMETE